MTGRRALGTKPDHDIGPMPTHERNDVADEPRLIRLLHFAVAIAAELDRLDAEDGARRVNFLAPDRRLLFTILNRDAGCFAGAPVRCTEEIDFHTGGRVLRDDAANAEGLVIGMCENQPDAARQTSDDPGRRARG